MYIGEIARKTGLSIKAIRLYEEKKLIPPPKRSGRYRVYTDADIELLLLIKDAKALGVTLAQLESLIAIEAGPPDWQKIEQFLQQQKRRIYGEIAALNATIAKIDDCLRQLHACPKAA